MAFAEFRKRALEKKFHILSVFNLLLVTGIGIWTSVQYVMNTMDYSHYISMLDSPQPVDEDEEADVNSICLHTDENRDVLVHALYYNTALVILYTLVEILVSILLTRLVFNSRVTNSEYIETAYKFWASYQLLLIVLLTVAFFIFLPLKQGVDASVIILNVLKFIFLLSWKSFILIIYYRHYSKIGEQNKSRSPHRRETADRVRSIGWIVNEEKY